MCQDQYPCPRDWPMLGSCRSSVMQPLPAADRRAMCEPGPSAKPVWHLESPAQLQHVRVHCAQILHVTWFWHVMTLQRPGYMSPEDGWENSLSVFPPPGGDGEHLLNHHHPPKVKGREKRGQEQEKFSAGQHSRVQSCYWQVPSAEVPVLFAKQPRGPAQILSSQIIQWSFFHHAPFIMSESLHHPWSDTSGSLWEDAAMSSQKDEGFVLHFSLHRG